MNADETTKTTKFDLPLWSAAEFLDMPFSDGVLLRALICRLGPGKWQWSIMSIDGNRGGEVICLGTEQTVAAARQTAASELDKCIHDPLN